MGQPYSQEVQDFIRENAAELPAPKLAQLIKENFGIDIGTATIHYYKRKFGLTTSNLFPVDVQEYIRLNYQGVHYRELAERVNLSFGTTYTPTQIRSYCTWRGFQNGYRPGDSGALPPNTKPVGSERHTGCGFIAVKVKERPSKRGKNDHLALKHRLVWERAYGPIPDGCTLIFLDGDHTNCALENLQLVSRSESAVMAQRGLYFPNPDLRRSGALVAKVIVATKERQKNLNKE